MDFGSVQVGQAASRHILGSNRTMQTLTVPPINVAASDFSLQGAPAAGASLEPGQPSGFDVQFMPSGVGPRTGTCSWAQDFHTDRSRHRAAHTPAATQHQPSSGRKRPARNYQRELRRAGFDER